MYCLTGMLSIYFATFSKHPFFKMSALCAQAYAELGGGADAQPCALSTEKRKKAVCTVRLQRVG